MWKTNNHTKEITLSHFSDTGKNEILFIAEHFSTLLKAGIALLFGYLFFVPFFQIISAAILLFILFYPEQWRTLSPEKAERKKHIAALSLIVSDIIINADTLFLIAASAYVSHVFLVVSVVTFSLVVLMIKNTHKDRPFHQTLLHRIIIHIHSWFKLLCEKYAHSTPTQVFHFMWYGMLSFQAGFMATYDTYSREMFHFTSTSGVYAGIITELIAYGILFWKWGTYKKIAQSMKQFITP